MIPVVALAFALGLGAGPYLGTGAAGATTGRGGAAFARGGSSTPLTASTPAVTTGLAVTPEIAYDLAEANGKVEPLGGAAYYGSAYGAYITAPIVAMMSTPDLKGYWLVGADGSVYPFGDARDEGGAGGSVRADPVVAAAATTGSARKLPPAPPSLRASPNG